MVFSLKNVKQTVGHWNIEQIQQNGSRPRNGPEINVNPDHSKGIEVGDAAMEGDDGDGDDEETEDEEMDPVPTVNMVQEPKANEHDTERSERTEPQEIQTTDIVVAESANSINGPRGLSREIIINIISFVQIGHFRKIAVLNRKWNRLLLQSPDIYKFVCSESCFFSQNSLLCSPNVPETLSVSAGFRGEIC